MTSSIERVFKTLGSSGKDTIIGFRALCSDPFFDVNERNSSGMSPLKATVMCGGVEELVCLLQAGAEADEGIKEFVRTKYPHKFELEAVLLSHMAREAVSRTLLKAIKKSNSAP